MKNEYIIYGRSESLENNLTKGDKEILKDYLEFCGMSAGEGKLKAYRRYMLQFRDIVEKPLNKINRKDAVGFWALVNHAHHEPNTKVMMKRTVKRFLRWFYRDLEMIEPLKNQSPTINKKKINKSTLLTPEEIEKMLRSADTLRDKALVITLYETGARPQEIRDLKWKDVNWDNKEIQLYSTKKQDGRSLPVKHSILHLKRWKQEWTFPDVTEDDYVFPSFSFQMAGNKSILLPHRERHITTEYIEKIIKKISKRAGIKRRVYPYLLRHSRLSEIYNKGVKGQEHNLFAGHEVGSKQQHTYVHLDDDDMKSEVLSKVYDIKELTEEEEHELKKQIRLLGENYVRLEEDHQKVIKEVNVIRKAMGK